VDQMLEQFVFLWNVPATMTWKEVQGIIHPKVIKVETMSMIEPETSQERTKTVILQVFSTSESTFLEKELNGIELRNGETMRANVETSLYVFFITDYTMHIPNFIKQNLRNFTMSVDEGKGIIRCEFNTYGDFTRAYKSIEAMMANSVKMKMYRYTKGGNKLPAPSVLSLKFHSIPRRQEESDHDLVPYNPPSTAEINLWVMEKDYKMWNALNSVKYPTIPSCLM
ncbi:hypothetical protein PFISCL1PPCAC_24431, partial [Pristionchus fissidentatus]